MKFIEADTGNVTGPGLEDEWKAGRKIGVLRFGTEHLFFRSGIRSFVLPYDRLAGCFRRVVLVPAKMCCGRGDFEIEHLILRAGDAGALREIADIELPGKKAAQEAMRILKEMAPDADFSVPGKADAQ